MRCLPGLDVLQFWSARSYGAWRGRFQPAIYEVLNATGRGVHTGALGKEPASNPNPVGNRTRLTWSSGPRLARMRASRSLQWWPAHARAQSGTCDDTCGDTPSTGGRTHLAHTSANIGENHRDLAAPRCSRRPSSFYGPLQRHIGETLRRGPAYPAQERCGRRGAAGGLRADVGARGPYDASKASPVTWMATMARNRALDEVRRKQPTPSTMPASSSTASATRTIRCSSSSRASSCSPPAPVPGAARRRAPPGRAAGLPRGHEPRGTGGALRLPGRHRQILAAPQPTAAQGLPGAMRARDEIDVLAGEYVLGTLDAAERTAVGARRRREAPLDAAIEAWEERLAPLAETLPAVAPAAGLWPSIETRLDAGGRATRARSASSTWSGARSAGAGWRSPPPRWQPACSSPSVCARSCGRRRPRPTSPCSRRTTPPRPSCSPSISTRACCRSARWRRPPARQELSALDRLGQAGPRAAVARPDRGARPAPPSASSPRSIARSSSRRPSASASSPRAARRRASRRAQRSTPS